MPIKTVRKTSRRIILNIYPALLLVAGVLIIGGCSDQNRLFEDYSNVSEQGWHQDSIVQFSFEVPQVEEQFDISVTLRNRLTYPYTNLYVEYRLLNAEGNQVSRELEEVILFDPKTGKPLGSGMSDVFDHEHLMLQDFNFPNAGTYTIQFQQYMRMEMLPDIISVGVSVVESS